MVIVLTASHVHADKDHAVGLPLHVFAVSRKLGVGTLALQFQGPLPQRLVTRKEHLSQLGQSL